jgi:hypothetical protein
MFALQAKAAIVDDKQIFMKARIFKHLSQAFGRLCFDSRLCGVATAIAFLLSAANLSAAPVVTTLSGGPNSSNAKYYGYTDGNTKQTAQFHTPVGLALDSSQTFLFVADRDNNAIRMLDLLENYTFTFAVGSPISKPIGVVLDSDDNVYVLNRGTTNNVSTNGTVVEFDTYGDLIATNATGLTNAAAMAMDNVGNIYVTVSSNKLIRIAPNDVVTTVATVTNAGTSLQGIVVMDSGLIAACDSGRNGVLIIDPTTGIATALTGFNGSGDYSGIDNRGATSGSGPTHAAFFQPGGVAKAGGGVLVVTDTGNNRVKVINAIDVTTNLYGVHSNLWYFGTSSTLNKTVFPGWHDGTVTVPDAVGDVEARLPVGVVVADDGSVYVTEDYYHLIRQVTSTGLQPPAPAPPSAPIILTVVTNYGQVTLTWSAVSGAVSYNLKRATSSGGPYATIVNTTSTSYTDTSVINGTTYYYVVSAVGAGGEGFNSSEVSATPPIPPPPAPEIGWFDYEGNNQTGFFTVIHPVGISIFNNDQLIAINPTTNGVATYYITTNGPQPVLEVPSSTNGSTPPFYQDGLAYAQPLSLTTVPDLVIKAVNVGPGGSSAVTTSEFIFQVANPTITGNNGAQFTISDVTTNVSFYYTTDGSSPTNDGSGTSIGPIVSTNGGSVALSLNVSSNIVFTVRAFRSGYLPSGSAIQVFSSSTFVPNSISFGFVSGEASSDFIASPGQTFYAPVTLSILPNVLMYSLQFNLTVTNAGPNPGPAITPGAFGFSSMLVKPIPGTTPPIYETIPPFMFIGDATGNVPPSQIVTYQGTNFVDLEVANTNINLLAVGWLERAGIGATNLYDTTSQDLIQYSQAHDTLFLQASGQIIVGGYAFQVPTTALPGQTYQIQIGRPSATSDGVGAPGSSIFIYAPTNGSLGGGAINALKNVTTGQRKYLAGDAYPFRWFNAGDFGNTNLENADVEQVFEAAVYGADSPPAGSDFFDSMDSCGNTYVDNGHGYLENSGVAGNTSVLYNGNDTTINQIAFGDGTLDVADVYVTYRRSLDPSLTWFTRFWTNGIRAAQIVPNVYNPNVAAKTSASVVSKVQPAVSSNSSSTNKPVVNFSAADFVASSGQVLQVPVTAQIYGSYPLRVLMLNLTVEPLDGSPALTTAVQFTPNSALGSPTFTSSDGNGNYAAAWLNSTISGLTGNASIGTLTVTVPKNAPGIASYAVHFDHASASPNGIATFPKQTLTGLITLAPRTNSCYGDGIPDSWRLRWFGTTNNLLSVSNACPTGDGISNWKKYVAGVDPNVANDFPSLNPQTPVPSGATAAIHWPTVSDKQYVILRSSSLFSGAWSAIATNTGTGTDMEFDDNSAGTMKFYRVQILP